MENDFLITINSEEEEKYYEIIFVLQSLPLIARADIGTHRLQATPNKYSR